MDTTAAAGASTVRIAVNDITGSPAWFSRVDDDLLIPLRAARSLSRLDTVLRADKHACHVTSETLSAGCHLAFKCPSFPGIDRYSSVDEMRLTLDADSMSPRLSNATLSQDLDGELLALSVSNLCVPTSSTTSRHDTTLTRSVSARTVTLTHTGTTTNNLLAPPGGLTSAVTTLTCRSLTRSTSCPTISLPSLHLSPSPSSLLHTLTTASSSTQRDAGQHPGTTASRPGRGRTQFDSDVDLGSERVTDLPVIATSDFPEFLYEQSEVRPLTGAQLTVADLARSSTSQRFVPRGGTDVHLLAHLTLYSPHRHRSPQHVQIKCLQWLNGLDHGPV